MASLTTKMILPSENGYRAWEDQTLFKWRKRDPHVTLRCHDSVEGKLITLSPESLILSFQKRISIAQRIDFYLPTRLNVPDDS